jgi:hypothetical protein
MRIEAAVYTFARSISITANYAQIACVIANRLRQSPITPNGYGMCLQMKAGRNGENCTPNTLKNAQPILKPSKQHGEDMTELGIKDYGI